MQRRTEFVAKAEMVGRTKVAGSFAWLKIASRQLLFLIFTSFPLRLRGLFNGAIECGMQVRLTKSYCSCCHCRRAWREGPADSLRACRAESCPNDNFE